MYVGNYFTEIFYYIVSFADTFLKGWIRYPKKSHRTGSKTMIYQANNKRSSHRFSEIVFYRYTSSHSVLFLVRGMFTLVLFLSKCTYMLTFWFHVCYDIQHPPSCFCCIKCSELFIHIVSLGSVQFLQNAYFILSLT